MSQHSSSSLPMSQSPLPSKERRKRARQISEERGPHDPLFFLKRFPWVGSQLQVLSARRYARVSPCKRKIAVGFCKSKEVFDAMTSFFDFHCCWHEESQTGVAILEFLTSGDAQEFLHECASYVRNPSLSERIDYFVYGAIAKCENNALRE